MSEVFPFEELEWSPFDRRPLTVYKDDGKWWFDCRLCGTANPNSSATHGLAFEQADRHYHAIHTYSPFDRRVA